MSENNNSYIPTGIELEVRKLEESNAGISSASSYSSTEYTIKPSDDLRLVLQRTAKSNFLQTLTDNTDNKVLLPDDNCVQDVKLPKRLVRNPTDNLLDVCCIHCNETQSRLSLVEQEMESMRLLIADLTTALFNNIGPTHSTGPAIPPTQALISVTTEERQCSSENFHNICQEKMTSKAPSNNRDESQKKQLKHTQNGILIDSTSTNDTHSGHVFQSNGSSRRMSKKSKLITLPSDDSPSGTELNVTVNVDPVNLPISKAVRLTNRLVSGNNDIMTNPIQFMPSPSNQDAPAMGPDSPSAISIRTAGSADAVKDKTVGPVYRREQCLIVKGLPEINDSASTVRIANDLSEFGKCVTAVLNKDERVEICKAFRIGKYESQETCRPLKIIFKTEHQKEMLLARKSLLKNLHPHVFFQQDYTPKEREKYRELQRILHTRQLNGEIGLIIKDGQIVKKNETFLWKCPYVISL
jgi:hypothetical protein